MYEYLFPYLLNLFNITHHSCFLMFMLSDRGVKLNNRILVFLNHVFMAFMHYLVEKLNFHILKMTIYRSLYFYNAYVHFCIQVLQNEKLNKPYLLLTEHPKASFTLPAPWNFSIQPQTMPVLTYEFERIKTEKFFIRLKLCFRNGMVRGGRERFMELQ